MKRITELMLKKRVEYLNTIKGFEPNPPYSTIGAYTLDYAYGGVSLHQYVNKGGAVTDIFRCGHMAKRELFNRIDAYTDGIISTL